MVIKKLFEVEIVIFSSIVTLKGLNFCKELCLNISIKFSEKGIDFRLLSYRKDP